MRFLLVAFLSTMMISCGQNGSSSKSGSGEQREEDYVTDIREVDLLDVALDVPVEVSGSQIMFKQSVNNSLTGMRVTCSAAVQNGETYSYKLDGNSLTLKTSSGEQMKLKRVSGGGGSIVGSWSGKSSGNGMLVQRRITFVSESRMIMRTHCES